MCCLEQSFILPFPDPHKKVYITYSKLKKGAAPMKVKPEQIAPLAHPPISSCASHVDAFSHDVNKQT